MYWTSSPSSATRVVSLPAPAILGLLFAGLILVGTALLKLPIATRTPITWLDAAFTATSAVTVTGLTVIDVGAELSRFGQVVALLLFQLGGLGIITFAVMMFSLLGQRIGLRQQLLLREDLNQTSLGTLVSLARRIGGIVLVVELIGTSLLTFRFVPDLGWGDGLYYSLFYAVSAFNNAGFTLFPDSLTRYATDPLVNIVTSLLVIVGGLGFGVLAELYTDRRKRLSLHSQLLLLGTAVLLMWGFFAFLLLEWNNPATLGQYSSWGDRAIAAWFQAVTPRSGGLNTLDIAAIEEPTALMLISLMFIGGGSTSTAGGIKVTSFMVLVAATLAFLRGRREPSAFGRRVPAADILKVLALTFISLVFVMVGTFLLMLTQPLPFIDLAFEATSAFATVGLSRNVTGQLDTFGQLLVMLLMFVGRLGPLALGFILATAAAGRIRYPEGRVYIG